MIRFAGLVALCVSLSVSLAQAQPAAVPESQAKQKCSVEAQKAELAKRRPGLLALLGLDDLRSGACEAAGNVMRLLSSRKETAGRQLEPSRGFDPAAAEAELQAALATPEIRDAVEAELAGVTSEIRRQFLTAVVMADQGKHRAKELLLAKVVAAAERP